MMVLLLLYSSLYCQYIAAQICDGCIDISTEKDLYRPSEHVEINIDVIVNKIPNRFVDAHVAWVQPSGDVNFKRQFLNWQVNEIKGDQIVVEPLKKKEIGGHQIYFILARVDSDPLVSNNWLAAKSIEISLLPENWKVSEQETISYNNRGLPQFVSHGGGEISGRRVTNSLQALNNAYDQGQRFIEVDFSWTSDNHLVLIHDWDISYQNLFSQYSDAPNLEKFNQLIMNYELTQLNLDQLLAWLHAHPDTTIITDIKDRNLEGLAYIAERAGDVKKQFIPQIYGVNEYNPAVELGFRNIIFTLYRTNISDSEVLDFASKNSLVALTLPTTRAVKSTLAQKLKHSGVFVYAHTINKNEVFNFLQSKGVSGIYSDILLPDK